MRALQRLCGGLANGRPTWRDLWRSQVELLCSKPTWGYMLHTHAYKCPACVFAHAPNGTAKNVSPGSLSLFTVLVAKACKPTSYRQRLLSLLPLACNLQLAALYLLPVPVARLMNQRAVQLLVKGLWLAGFFGPGYAAGHSVSDTGDAQRGRGDLLWTLWVWDVAQRGCHLNQ